MDASPLEEIYRVLGRSALGEYDAVASVVALCSVVERPGVVCGLVLLAPVGEQSVFGSEKARQEQALLTRVASVTAPNRAYHTPHDGRWAELFATLPAAPSMAAWVACEPVPTDDGTSDAAIVVVGESEASRDDTLVVLPPLARALAVVLAPERNAASIRRLTHAMNNLLTTVIVNVGYVSQLIEEEAGRMPLAASRDDLAQAMRHVLEASHKMAVPVAQIGKRAQPRGGSL